MCVRPSNLLLAWLDDLCFSSLGVSWLCLCVCLCTRACVSQQIGLTHKSAHPGLCITLIALLGSVSADGTLTASVGLPLPRRSRLCVSLVWQSCRLATCYTVIPPQQAKDLRQDFNLKIHLPNQSESRTGAEGKQSPSSRLASFSQIHFWGRKHRVLVQMCKISQWERQCRIITIWRSWFKGNMNSLLKVKHKPIVL